MACLFVVFENCFLFSKIKKTGKTCLVSVFVLLKNIKTLHLNDKEEFFENTFLVFIVFKNYSQKLFSKTGIKQTLLLETGFSTYLETAF